MRAACCARPFHLLPHDHDHDHGHPGEHDDHPNPCDNNAIITISGNSSSMSRNTMSSGNCRKVVIFDTNAYRVFTFGWSLNEARAKAINLRQVEDQFGYAALAHPTVVWELLTHLVDSSNPAYSHCLKALVALREHTVTRENTNGGICLIADALSTVCRELFGRLPPGYEQGLQNLGSVVNHIAKYASDLSDPLLRQNIENLGRGMVAREAAWLK
jgi:hypothetical protein